MGRFDDTPRETVLGLEVPVATGFRARLVGLAFLNRVEAADGLLIPRCRCVHTFGMEFAVDLLFLDREGRVVKLLRGVPPGRIVRCRGADAVLELPAPESG